MYSIKMTITEFKEFMTRNNALYSEYYTFVEWLEEQQTTDIIMSPEVKEYIGNRMKDGLKITNLPEELLKTFDYTELRLLVEFKTPKQKYRVILWYHSGENVWKRKFTVKETQREKYQEVLDNFYTLPTVTVFK